MAGRLASAFGTQIAADVSCRNAGGPTAADEDVRLVLADPLTGLECVRCRILDVRNARLVAHALLNGCGEGVEAVSSGSITSQVRTGEVAHLLIRCGQRSRGQIGQWRQGTIVA